MEIGNQINRRQKNIRFLSQENILIYFTVALFILFSLAAKGFFDMTNFFTILRAMSVITILGLGITFVLTAGEIDLSIGTVPAMCGAILAALLEKGFPLLPTILIAALAAVVVGLINGLIIVKAGMPSIIITLATYMIASGIANILTHQTAIVVTNETFLRAFGGNILGFPVIVLWMLVFTVMSYYLLHALKFGRNIAFIGDNRTAAYFAGIKVGAILNLAYVICAFYSFMAGMLGVAQTSNATPWMITQDMMTAIAATLIGGTSMAGGKGNILGTIIGAFFLTMLSNGLLILGIEQWVLYSINGIIIIFALSWKYLPRK